MRPSKGSPAADVALAGLQPPAGGWRSDAAKSVCVQTGLEDPPQAIARLAADLLAETGLVRPFQNLHLIASHQDVRRIDIVRMLDAGRLVMVGDGGFVIHVNADHSRGKQNFSICHEIGHTLIPSFWDSPAPRVDQSTGEYTVDREEEFLCDLAASELLMPTSTFVKALRWHKVHSWALGELAKEFGASLEATAIKCVRCGLVPLAVIVWEPLVTERSSGRYHAPTSPLRVKFACCGPGFENYTFPRGSVISGESLVHKAYEQDGSTQGEDELPISGGSRRFYTESTAFQYLLRDGWERKVITFVFADDCGAQSMGW